MLKRIIGILLHPAGTFQSTKKDTPFQLAGYVLALLLLNSILTAITSSMQIGENLHLFTPLMEALTVFVIGIIGIPFLGVITHVGVKIAGTKEDFLMTMRAVCYGLTPLLLTSWILPLISPTGIFGVVWTALSTILGILLHSASSGSLLVLGFLIIIAIWSLGLTAVGLKELHGISLPIAVIGMFVVPLVLCVLAIPAFIILFAIGWGMGQMSVVPFDFSVERIGDDLYLSNNGVFEPNDISAINIYQGGIFMGNLGVDAGSMLIIHGDPCPADLDIVVTSGWSNHTHSWPETVCPNDIAAFTIIKMNDTVLVRTDTCQDPNTVERFLVDLKIMGGRVEGETKPLGIQQGSEVTFITSDCEPLVRVIALLKSGREVPIVYEFIGDCGFPVEKRKTRQEVAISIEQNSIIR
jgi:hypothetical protein